MRIHRIGQTKEVKIRRFIIKVASSFSATEASFTTISPKSGKMLIVRNLLGNDCMLHFVKRREQLRREWKRFRRGNRE